MIIDSGVVTGSLEIQGPLVVTGSINVTQGITGSLFGTAATASFVLNAISSSYSATASYAANVSVTSSYALTASYIVNAQTASYVENAQTASYVVNALTASYVLNAISSSLAATASYVVSALTASYVTNAISASQANNAHTASYVVNALTASYVLNAVSASQADNAHTASYVASAQTASYVLNAISASQADNAHTASYVASAQTASYVLNALSASLAATASTADNFTVRGTLTAQTLVVQTITSSIVYSSGSNRFGSQLTDTQAITGSTGVTGSLEVNGYNVVTADQTSSMSVASSSFALTASYAANVPVTSSYALTASYVVNALTASYVVNALTASYVTNAISASQAANSYTASYVLNAQTASYAFTASYISGSGAGSGFPFSGSGVITGSLLVSGTFIVSGTVDFANANIDNSRYLHSQTSAANTWSVNHNLEYSYPNVTIYDTTGYVIQPDEIISVDNNTTSVLFTVAQAGYANVSVGGISTGQADRFLFTQSSATGSWVINHGLNYKYVNVDIYDNNDQLMIPQVVTATDVNTLTVTFVTATSGNAIISKGGARTTSLFVDRSNGNYSFSGSMNVTGSGIFSGDVDANNFNTTSDSRLKTNLELVEGALDKIEALNGYTFNWIQDFSGKNTRQIGLIAQEVHSVQPELISYREYNQQEIMVLDYSKVTALLVNAVKELSAKVKDLESKINN